jgi:Sec-independent protein translocase protein TatA
MLDVSWAETLILFGVGTYLVGRRDLPVATRFLGKQVGRVVGVLQGARARADRFAADSELTKLHAELRSGLRELDMVRGEMATAAGSGLVGRGLGGGLGPKSLGRTLPQGGHGRPPPASIAAVGAAAVTPADRSASIPSGRDYLAAARASEIASSITPAYAAASPLGLAPRSQSVAAVAEEQWEKRGIGFISRAERGVGGAWDGHLGAVIGGGGGRRPFESGGGAKGAESSAAAGGAALLSDLIQQSLIHDQYDRAVKEQDEALHRRADRIREEADKGHEKDK